MAPKPDHSAFPHICELIAEGRSLRSICRDSGMPSVSTVMRWLAEFPDMREQYARARELQADAFAEEILEIADDATNDWMVRQSESGGAPAAMVNHDHISRSRLRVDARKWLMSKMAPKKYGDKIEHEVAGKDGQAIAMIHRIERVIVRPEHKDG